MALILMPYYANYLGLQDEEVLEVCRGFIENSCKNFNNCGEIYESWLRSQLKTVRNNKYKVISRSKLQKEHPDLYAALANIFP